MLTVSKECRFDAAHVLGDHRGLCRNLHGHTYRVVVEVAETADAGDMVMDFKDLKQVLREVISDRFDHALLYYEKGGAAERELAEVAIRHGMRCVGLPFRSTAENLARYFFQELAVRVRVVSVRVYETPESCATYQEAGNR